MRTKWDVLQERLAEAKNAVEKLEGELRYLRDTPFLQWQLDGTSMEPGRCSGCQAEIGTEEKFARHFVISDERYLNLGHCPNRP